MTDTKEKESLGFAQRKREGKPNGILFAEDGTRTLWMNAEKLAPGVLAKKFSLHDYFYNLRFLDDFPEITHWAFGDAWTQQVMLKAPRRIFDEMVGTVFFGSELDQGTYIIELSYDDAHRRAPAIQTPLPELFNKPLNLPLRILIAKMAFAALDDDLPYEQWHFVTSLLTRDEVADVLTTDMAAAYGFRIMGVANDLRQALCELQGIRGE